MCLRHARHLKPLAQGTCCPKHLFKGSLSDGGTFGLPLEVPGAVGGPLAMWRGPQELQEHFHGMGWNLERILSDQRTFGASSRTKRILKRYRHITCYSSNNIIPACISRLIAGNWLQKSGSCFEELFWLTLSLLTLHMHCSVKSC